MANPAKCDSCGAAVDLDSDPSADWDHLVMCAECRAQSGQGDLPTYVDGDNGGGVLLDSRCHNCGFKGNAPEAEECMNCEAIIIEGQEFCENCSEPLVAGEGRYCSECGG
jgi:hypothetical protein